MTRPRMPFRRAAIVLATLGMLFTSQAAPIFVQTARAIPVEVVASPVDDIGRILDEILTQLVRAATVALFNAAQTFLGQLAYDAANYVATGGKGQGPLTQAKSPGDYFAQVGQDALGSAIGSLSDEFFESSLGFDLCAPPNPRNLLNLQVSLGGLVPSRQGAFSRPRPTCDFQQVVHNYDQFFTTLSSVDLLQNINASFNTNSSELGASLQIFGRSVGKVSLDVQKAAQDRGESGAFKGITDVISGNVKTPAALVAASTEEQLVEGPQRDEGARRNAILSSAAEQGPVQLITYTASMFINTLGSKLMDRIMSKGLIGAFDFSDLERQSAIASANPDAIPARSRADARRANLSLKDVNLIRQSNIEILSELIACPDVRGTWNCTMDQQLASAISGNACDNGSCTIAKAVEKGLMKGDWKLYPDTLIRQNQDRDCYQQAFCSGNLRKLRLMRILPVGFEFAANSDTNIDRCASSAGCITLREVMDSFDSCNAQGERDAEFPWCKLIDPNWTLTSFSQQCRLTGFGETLVSERLGQRKEECRDIQTCLSRNDKGECVGGYGYCVAEKTVYRFKGDECPEEAASCRVFATRAGSQASYLRTTLDYDSCSESNVGCLGYATLRNADGTVWNASTSSRIYFDSTLKTCGAGDEGCTKLLAAEVGGTSLNLLKNPSFERLTAAPTLLQDWTTTPAGTYAIGSSASGRVAFDGALSLTLRSADTYEQRVPTYPGRVLTMSLYARAKETGDIPVVNMTASQFNASGARIPSATIDTLFKSPSCITGSSDPALGTSDDGVSTFGTDWIRLECSFLTSNNTASLLITLYGKNVLVDAVELEEGQFSTPFVNGTNNALPVVHMRVAPEELACTGAATDPTICSKFASSCRQVDAGCMGYRDNSGAPEVPAILSSNDLCPQECVGYAEYRKQPSSFDLVQDPDPRFSDPSDDGKAYLIPNTARQCSQQEVGCESFTNLEAAAAGGEESTPFSYVRLCEKPDDALTQTYFTWEGSETAGYQLRTWSLMSVSGAGSGPDIVARHGPDGTFKDPATCNEALWRTGFDPDCRQYYDREGAVYYAFESQTVVSSADCRNYRLGRRSNIQDCSNTGGIFNVATGECTYHVLASESRSCTATVAGCRAYAGAGAGNVQTVVDENFRGGRGSFSAGDPSTESLLVGDQSLRLQTGAALVTTVDFPSTSADLFRVSFWAKGAGVGQTIRLQVRDAAAAASTPVDVGTAQLSGDWQRFSFGLFNGYSGASTSSLVMTLGGAGSLSAFIDEVRIEQVQDMAYVVADSWTTPNSCDRTFSGIPEPQAMLGCRAYTDRFNNTVNAAKFTRLCSEAAIGCRAFVDTRNSDANESQTFVQADATPVPTRTLPAGTTPGPSDVFPAATTTRAADRMLYLIYDSSKLCQAENDSCRAFGKAEWTMDRGSVESFETVYYKDDITAYGQALCKPSEEFCEEFTYNGAKDYFKDPGEKACEFKDGIRLSAFDFYDAASDTYSPASFEFLAEGTFSGWFRKGSNVPCYPDNLQSGNFFGLPKRGDEPYTGWVGLCDAQYGECTEFRDPNDTSDPDHRSGKPYFFVDNSKLDKASCSGNYDQGSGCILLRSTSDPTSQWSTVATDLAYRDNHNRSVQPINCTENPTSPFCAGRCRGTKTVRFGGVATESAYVGEICDENADCVIPSEPSGCTGSACTTSYSLTCQRPQNDANVLVKVNTDRDCAQWLGCQSAETVFDTATNQYKDVCTNLALCDKASGEPGDIFCAHYVERTPQQEPILTQGKFFDADAYSSRPTGLGQKDYTGYAVPDSFQISDTVMTRVGVDGALTVQDAQNRFAQDYRLAAVAKIPVNIRAGRVSGRYGLYNAAQTADDQAYTLEPDSDIGRANPALKLCQHKGSQIIGYYLDEDRNAAVNNGRPFFNCYLPVRADSLAYNFQNLVGIFAGESPATDIVLNKAYPEPECRANPEADSPYPARFVTAWDFSKNLPSAISKVSGFQNAKTCEYGEDCSCSYKRVEYEVPTLTKFFGTLSSAVPPGVCFGGPRNGQSCLPTAILATSGGSSALVDQGLQAANAEQLCGDPIHGGRCIATTKIDVIRGVFGQCLERDTTRILGSDRTALPCLTWNPNPILFGEKDPYHYQPTSGYLPPQNSGQYYCASPSSAPVSFKMSATHFRRFYQPTHSLANQNIRFMSDYPPDPSSGRRVGCNFEGYDENQADSYRINLSREGRGCDPPYTQGQVQGGAGSSNLDYYEAQFDQHLGAPYYAGKMSRIDYGPQWLENENRCEGAGGEECDFMSASLVEAHPINNYPAAVQCQQAYNSTGGGAQGNPWPTAVRLIDAGGGYTETFFRINDVQFAKALGATSPLQYDRFLSDNTIGYIRANPAMGSGSGLLGCGYQAAWADNMPSIDFNNADSIRQGEGQFRQDLARNYNPYLTRSGEKVLSYGAVGTSEAIKMKCFSVDDGTETSVGDGTTSSDCYFKFWETGLNNEDQRQFDGIYSSTGVIVRNLNDIRRHAVTAARCESGKPYFGIRAVFQTRDATVETGRTASGPVTSEEVAGKGVWRLVGFWVTACAGAAGNDQRYIYMDMEVGAANVCNDLVEVQSKGTRQDAAFTDRVWSQGGFREQNIGTRYGDAASPFSSAINTRPAGKDPLFQTGQELAGFSRLNPPTFLRSGIFTYYKNVSSPRDKYAYLSNLFARIYRIYRFQYYPVNRGDMACVVGPFKGTKCSRAGDPVCAVNGTCRPELLSAADVATLTVCNRGPHAGLQCNDEAECKAGGTQNPDGSYNLTLSRCALRDASAGFGAPLWAVRSGTLGQPDARYDQTSGGTLTNRTPQQAADDGAFVCTSGSRIRENCSAPEENSAECPLGITEDDYAAATCGAPDPVNEAALIRQIGRCDGGLKANQVCKVGTNDCFVSDFIPGACGAVDSGSPDFDPTDACQAPGTSGPNRETNPDLDSNVCTHSSGYQPRQDICPNPSDEYCGLIAYKINDTSRYVFGASPPVGSMDPAAPYPLPTDVTLGHYTPTFLGFPSTPPPVSANTFNYITYYTPRPPAVAAPDTRACPTPGQCPIASMNTVAFDGQAEGPVVAGGGQHKASLRFYAWASHNQMPLRQIMIDWGDGKIQTIDDTKLKNRKPFCGVQKECTNVPGSSSGLTCQTDADCPAGSGRCAPVGTCANRPQQACSVDGDCTVGTRRDTCQIRTLFGNASDACQQDYFDFGHVYTCGANEQRTLPSCSASFGGPPVAPGQCYFGTFLDGTVVTYIPRPSCTAVSDCTAAYTAEFGDPGTSGADFSCGPGVAPIITTRCSRDPSRLCTPGATGPFPTVPGTCAPGDTCIENLSPPSGCFDTDSASCRFTPRLMIQDNWGWCTGECRNAITGGALVDASGATVKHAYGGCWSGSTFGSNDTNVRFNTKSTESAISAATPRRDALFVVAESECRAEGITNTAVRPWIVYPGSLQLRRSNEVVE